MSKEEESHSKVLKTLKCGAHNETQGLNEMIRTHTEHRTTDADKAAASSRQPLHRSSHGTSSRHKLHALPAVAHLPIGERSMPCTVRMTQTWKVNSITFCEDYTQTQAEHKEGRIVNQINALFWMLLTAKKQAFRNTPVWWKNSLRCRIVFICLF